MKQRWRAGLLAVAMAISLSVPAWAESAVLTVKPPGEAVKAGETFTVEVDLTGNPGFDAVQFTLGFDDSVMDCTSARIGGLMDGSIGAANPDAADGAIVAAASFSTISQDGTIAQFRFTAKQDISDYRFTFSDAFLVSQGEEVPYTLSGATERQSAAPVTPAPAPAETPVTTTPAPVTTPTAPGQTTPTTPAAQQPAAPAAAPVPIAPETSTAGAEETPAAVFTDVAADFWGAQWIAEAARLGLFYGDNGKFRPNDPIKRGDFVLVLYRMAGQPEVTSTSTFQDVDPNAYYAKAVAWAASNGYVGGKGAGFAPSDSLTRQEAMKILFGYAGGRSGMEAMLTTIYDDMYADSGKIADWAKTPVYWAVYNGIISGMDGGLNPAGATTRAQMSKILVEYLKKGEST